MRFLPPMVLHGAHTVSTEDVAQHVVMFRDRLETYPQWSELDDLDTCPACQVPAADRPEN